MKIGYARVSTADQHLRMQEDALRNVGCKEIYHDIASGVKTARVGLEDACSHLRAGDTLVVWRLDRLGRSLRHVRLQLKITQRSANEINRGSAFSSDNYGVV